MGAFSVSHLLILLVIVVLVFGTSKLKGIGADLGGALKNFKKGMAEDDALHQNKSSDTEPTSDKNKLNIP